MCIDTAGTHYIRKIHYVGTKMEDAKGAVMTGLQHSEQVYLIPLPNKIYL